MKIKKILLVLAFCFVTVIVLAGCASIIHGGDQDVKIDSTPASAEIKITDVEGKVVFEGKTPATVKLSRKSSYNVAIIAAGYKETSIPITKNLDVLWYCGGNFILGGLVGWIVDPITGAMWNLAPDKINVSLVTAYHGRGKATFVVFRALDEEGKLRTFAVPLVES